MPKRRFAKSLSEICHRRIALSFDAFWMTHFDEHFREVPRLLYVIGPFETLGNDTIQSIINCLIVEKCLKRRHFMCLMQERITSLDLSKAGMAANNDSVLQIITSRCPRLVSFNMQGLNSVSAQAISNLIRALPGLKMLNMRITNCNDQVLSILGHECTGLLHLDISVTKTTNMGAFSLCQAFDQEKGCTNLLQLKIFGTMINAKGVIHLLQNLPKLQYLGFDDICGVIELDFKERERIPEFQPVEAYKLRNLFSHGIKVHPPSKTCVELACRLCPDTIEARLYCSVTNENISSLKTLKHLTSLDVGNSEGPDLTFEHGLLPVLVEIGQQLHELTIADVNDFDLLSIGHWCRNLTKLSILISGQFQNVHPVYDVISSEERNRLFDKLEYLNIVYPLEEIHFQKNAFVMMFKNAKLLKSLTIHYMNTLTSEMLLEVIAVNPLNKLDEFKLVSCDQIGAEPLEMMLKNDICHSLSSVELKGCRNITLQDFERFKSLIKSQGYSIEIAWT